MDTFWLNSAFYQASYALGRTGKNPAVGCVLIKNNQIVGVGSTSDKGRPHAEENAIKMAGNKTIGATMYVTLEPCNLIDNNFSCTKQIISNGIKKVVIGALDPNRLTFKKGYNELISKGIEVKLKKISLQNYLINYSHLCVHLKKRPMIAVKAAVSLDGNITHVSNKKRWITSKFSRLHVQQIRSFYEAILVGTNTMLLDNPSLNIRIDGHKQSNYRVIFDKYLKINLNSNLMKTIKINPLIIFTSKLHNKAKYRKLKQLGVYIYELDLSKDNYFSIESVIKNLFKSNIKSILIEGGAKVISSFLNKNLVDIIYLYRANFFTGKNSINLIDKIRNIDEFKLYNEIKLGEDQLEIWVNKNMTHNRI